MIIFLTGFMGCGKSTIGRRLARSLRCGFADTDRMIEEGERMTIAEIFEKHGEGYFRDRESAVIDSFDDDADLIVATGGGLPCFGDNMERMKAKGVVVYLRMTPEVIFRRLEKGRYRRPAVANMNDGELMDFIKEKLAVRENCYATASVVLDCNGVSDEYITSHVEHYIRQHDGRSMKLNKGLPF